MHTNTPKCVGCEKVLNKYPNFYQPLRDWFYSFRSKHIEGHVSWGGRGKADQELFYSKGLSKAHYGQSAHNYNCAIDFFRLGTNGADFGTPWYKETLGPEVLSDARLTWYGKPGAVFFEYPHVEWANWKELNLPLVEPI